MPWYQTQVQAQELLKGPVQTSDALPLAHCCTAIELHVEMFAAELAPPLESTKVISTVPGAPEEDDDDGVVVKLLAEVFRFRGHPVIKPATKATNDAKPRRLTISRRVELPNTRPVDAGSFYSRFSFRS